MEKFTKINQKTSLKGRYKFTIRDAKTNKIKKIVEYNNLIPLVGRALIANNLSSNAPTNDPYANYVALGTGTTAPANGDTTLETEVYRNPTASATNADNIAYITGFFSAADCNGTYKEAGIFCNGTGIADSGILLSRVAIDITKSATETLTLDFSLTIT